MKCAICGYDDIGTGDSAHSCNTASLRELIEQAQKLPNLFGTEPILLTPTQIGFIAGRMANQHARDAVAYDRLQRENIAEWDALPYAKHPPVTQEGEQSRTAGPAKGGHGEQNTMNPAQPVETTNKEKN